MAGKQPAFLFYPGDWKKDPQLSKCSLATRGIWIELLCAMHENGRTGIVSGTMEELAQICRCNPRELRRGLSELSTTKSAHVTFRTQKVIVLNRRMHREYKLREKNRLGVQRFREKKRGNGVVKKSSSSSSISSSREEEVEGSGLERERGALSDFSEEFFDDLQDQKKFAHLDVREVFRKFKDYYERRKMKLEPNKFIDWLSREVPNWKESSSDDDDRGTSAQAKRVAASLERDN